MQRKAKNEKNSTVGEPQHKIQYLGGRKIVSGKKKKLDRLGWNDGAGLSAL